MASDIDWDRVNELVDSAEEAMETLGDDNIDGPERREYGVYLSWTGDDGISRNVEASVHPGTYELAIAYNAWREHGLEGHTDEVRLWTRSEVGRFPDPTDAIHDAIVTAYDEAIGVADDDLSQAARLSRDRY